jgi:hypothetical protein
MTLRELVRMAHQNAESKGWWEGEDHNIPERLALIHSEISEALEAFRDSDGDGDLQCVSYNGDKPEGFPIELADAVLRIADLCGYLGIDFEAAVETKHAYNLTRSRRHGGRRC